MEEGAGRNNLRDKFYGIINANLPLQRQNFHPSFWETIDKRYADPTCEGGQRRYHTLEHVLDCCQVLDEYQAETDELSRAEYERLFIALVYHDIVYHSDGSVHNEQESALFAQRELFAMGVSYNFASDVGRFVLDTDHTRPLRDHHAASVIRDIDFHGMGLSYELFKGNGIRIQEEFNNVEEKDFIIGRYSFLNSVSKLSSIYKVDWFRRRYERQARSNINKRMSELAIEAKKLGFSCEN